MKVLKIIPLTFVLMLAACGGNATSSTTTSSQPPEPSSQETSSELDLYGFDLKKGEVISTASTYNLADQISLHNGVALSDLSFSVAERETPVATVDASGVLTRVSYGSTQVRISRKAMPLLDKIFTIHFFPNENSHIGRFTAELTADPDHPDNKVTVTIETKADNKFSISYTAGWVSVGTEEPTAYQVAATEAEGLFEFESILKFTVTTTSFPYKKTFSGRIIFDEANPIIDTRVPVAEGKISNRTHFNKVVA